MEAPRPSSLGWLGLAAGVYAYDRYCPTGEELSRRADEWLAHPAKRVVFIATVGALAAHLCNFLPPEIDVFHHLLNKPDRIVKMLEAQNG